MPDAFCPKCSAKHAVSDAIWAKLPGRSVNCQKCGARFQPRPAVPVVEIETDRRAMQDLAMFQPRQAEPVITEEEVEEYLTPVAEFEFEPPPVAEFESPMAEEYEPPAYRESRRLSHKVSDRSELTRLLQFMRFILRIMPYVIRVEMVGVTLLMFLSIRLEIDSSDGRASRLALGLAFVVGYYISLGLLVYVGTIVTTFCIRVLCELLEMLLHREVLFVAIANNTAKE